MNLQRQIFTFTFC